MNSRLILCCFLSFALAGCARDSPEPVGSDNANTLQAVATTGPVGDLLKRVGGDRLEVTVMMGPGVDPHLYRAVPSDLRKLDSADLIVYNGLHLEGRLTEALESMAKKKQVIAVTGSLLAEHDQRLLVPDGYEGVHDPHVWHDVSLWIDCAKHVAAKLVEFDPEYAAQYQSNATDYISELEALHIECLDKLDQIPESSRVMVTAHDAFAYFSRAYGLESVGLKGVSTEDEVDLGKMDDVANMLIERNAPCVFIESAVSPKIVESLVETCEHRGHPLRIGGELFADALGPEDSGANNYVGMIRANVSTIYAGLVREEIAAEESE